MNRLLGLSTLLILTACAAPLDTPTLLPSPTNTLTALPSVTSTSTATPSPTETATRTTIPTTTSSPTPLGSPISINHAVVDLLEQSPDCELPCWLGLRIGYPVGDVELTPYLYWNEENYLYHRGNHQLSSNQEEVRIDNYHWANDGSDKDYQAFTISLTTNKDSRALREITIQSRAQAFNQQLSPSRVIKELGAPADMRVNWSGPTEVDKMVAVSLWMVYDTGVVFMAESTWPAPDYHLEYCFGGSFWTYEFTRNYGIWIISLVEPLSNGLNELTPIQKELLENPILGPIDSMNPIEIEFGLTIDEVVELINSSETACIHKDFEFGGRRTPQPASQ